MTFLLDHLPPQFHLVIASRLDPPLPLSRLRVRHQLLEIRVDDLRFTIDEASTFLNEVMGLQLTTDDVAALETRTEGWIAGLQLVALPMQGRRDIASFVSAFTGSHRYIVDYLTEEVLGQQSEHIRTFLSHSHRLSGSLFRGAPRSRIGHRGSWRRPQTYRGRSVAHSSPLQKVVWRKFLYMFCANLCYYCLQS